MKPKRVELHLTPETYRIISAAPRSALIAALLESVALHVANMMEQAERDGDTTLPSPADLLEGGVVEFFNRGLATIDRNMAEQPGEDAAARPEQAATAAQRDAAADEAAAAIARARGRSIPGPGSDTQQ